MLSRNAPLVVVVLACALGGATCSSSNVPDPANMSVVNDNGDASTLPLY